MQLSLGNDESRASGPRIVFCDHVAHPIRLPAK